MRNSASDIDYETVRIRCVNNIVETTEFIDQKQFCNLINEDIYFQTTIEKLAEHRYFTIIDKMRHYS